jgi:hypothetical protein
MKSVAIIWQDTRELIEKKVTKNSIRSIKSVNIYENENKDLEKACIFRTQLSFFFYYVPKSCIDAE